VMAIVKSPLKVILKKNSQPALCGGKT
jgi:hypothetical protein